MVVAVDDSLLAPLSAGGTNHNELLIVALLLAVWLLVRVRRQEAERRPPPRRAPLNPHELGQVVFQAARSEDHEAYRGLFLAGREIATVFGEEAEAYLSRRSRAVIEDSLDAIADAIPEGSRYDGVEATAPDTYIIWIVPVEGPRAAIPIGTAVQVGALWRLRDPAIPPDRAAAD